MNASQIELPHQALLFSYFIFGEEEINQLSLTFQQQLQNIRIFAYSTSSAVILAEGGHSITV